MTVGQYHTDSAAPIDKSELPDDTEIVDEWPKGAIMSEYRTCGDGSCHCMNDGKKQGPYRYRVYREGGSVKKECLGKAEPRRGKHE